MQFRWPGPADIAYRFWRLRRLVVVCLALPMFALWAAGLAAPVVVCGIVSVLLLHVLLFPNATTETLSLSISLSLIIGLAGLLVGFAGPGYGMTPDGSILVLASVVLLCACVIFFIVQTGLDGLLRFWPATRRPLRGQLLFRRSMDDVRAVCCLAPEGTLGRIRSGPMDDNGIFECWLETDRTPGKRLTRTSETWRARILESDSHHHAVLVFQDTGHTLSLTVCRHQFRQLKGAVHVTSEELPEAFTGLLRALCWLTDHATDTLVEMRDRMEMRPTPALVDAHRLSIATLLARGATSHDGAGDMSDLFD